MRARRSNMVRGTGRKTVCRTFTMAPRATIAAAALAAGFTSLWPSTAEAGGLEYPAAGTRALGRAGAFTARADDPMALAYSPAALADIDGSQALLNVNLAFYHACVQRSGTYTDNIASTGDRSRFGDADELPGEGGYAREPFPKVCNEGPPGPGPALLFATELTDRIGIGLGVIAPVTAGSIQWGNRSGIVEGVNGEERPNPVRYMTLASEGFVIFPTAGIGVRVLPWLRVGAAFQAGVASLDLLSYSRASGSETPMTDGRAEISLKDTFVPAVITSVHVSAAPGLDVAAAFRWSDDIDAKADVDLLLGEFGTGDVGSTIPTENRFENADVVFPLPWQLSVGIRYGAKRDGAPPRPEANGRPRDPLAEEVWDIELDVIYEFNSRVDDLALRPQDDATLTTTFVAPPPAPGAPSETITNTVDSGVDLSIPHRWRDQIGVRLGGDYNIIENLLALRSGISFESNGVRDAFVQTDFIPAQRVGLHAGVTVRAGSFDLSAGYAHLFQKTVNASEDEARLTPVEPTGDQDTIINAGRYTASWDIVSVGASFKF